VIFPKRVLTDLYRYRSLWVGGETGAGKGTLALDLYHYFGDVGYRLISNMHCKLNNKLEDIDLDPNGQFNVFVISDEVGTFKRTKESIREIQNGKKKIGGIFLDTGHEAPHEDLWVPRIEPVGPFNPWLRLWRVVKASGLGKDTVYYFLQILPCAWYGFYSTMVFIHYPAEILSWCQWAIQRQTDFISQRLGIKSWKVSLVDVATGKKGMGESQSYPTYLLEKNKMASERRLSAALTKDRKSRR